MTDLTTDDLWQCLEDMSRRNKELEKKLMSKRKCFECYDNSMHYCQVCEKNSICTSCRNKDIRLTEWCFLDRCCDKCKRKMCKECVRACTDCINEGLEVTVLCKICDPKLQRGRRRGCCSSCTIYWYTCDKHREQWESTGCPFGHSDEEDS